MTPEDNNNSSPPTQPTIRSTSLIGTKLGDRFLIESELGRGGMGAVYLARDKPQMHSRQVVVKVLLEDALRSDWVVKKFQQEIESLTRLDDPGIVGIFDAGTLDDGTPYLVMQYIDGFTLRTLITQEGMDLGLVASIIKQIGRTVTAAHNAGILHRDLKPENIMLRKAATGELMVKIIDFGIAKVRNSVSGPTTAPGMTAGTIGYMSPEQLSAKPVSSASDIYSLGVIAHELITGRRPFNPASMFQLLEMQREGVKVKPIDLRPELPEEAQAIILKALSFNPYDRPESAQEFGDQLAQYLTSDENAAWTLQTIVSVDEGRQTHNDAVAPTLQVQTPEVTGASRTKPTLETAHVLFTDIVGYSKLLIDEQTDRLEELQDLIRSTNEFRIAEANNQLLRLPTGDGMALSFFGDPEAPVRCAVEISKLLKEHPNIKLRMGVHSGLVYRMADINKNLNVAGGGINMAQRVMDCGDAGHIILSKRVADDIGQLGRWAGSLHDLGAAEVKHGVIVQVVNLYNDDFGNPELPEKLRPLVVKKPAGRRGIFIAAGASLVLLLGIAGFFLIKSFLEPLRQLNYSIIAQKAQKSADGKYVPIGNEFSSAGDDIFGNGWKFRIKFTAPQSGSLYVLDKGPVDYNVLFPTPATSNGSAEVNANEPKQTGWLVFDNNTGNEQIYLIWADQPIRPLESIFKDAFNKNLVISTPDQIKTVEDILKQHASTSTEVTVDKMKNETVIRGRSNVVVSALILKHNDY